MSPKPADALQKIRDEFQRLPLKVPVRSGVSWALMPSGSPELLSHALLYLCQSMGIERATVFLLNDATQTLQAQELVEHGDVMVGEEEIAILPNSALSKLVSGEDGELLTVEGPPHVVYVPL